MTEKSITPISNKRKFTGIIIIVIASIILAISLFTGKENTELFLELLIATIITSIISIGIFWNYVDKRDLEKDNESELDKKPRIFVSVTTALYAIIAGFAVTEAVKNAFDGFGIKNDFPFYISFEVLQILMDEVTRLQPQFVITLIFLSTAIPFYHGAMVYLTSKGGIIVSEKKIGQLIHFVGLFSQSIIFLGIATSLDNISSVIALIALLLIVDSIWIIAGQFTKHRPPLGWLGLNILFIALINISNYPLWSEHSLLIILGFAILRTGIDYAGFQKIFFK